MKISNNAPRDTLVLDFGGRPKESFTSFIKADEIPDYEALDRSGETLKLSATQEVKDNSCVIFEAFGLIAE